MTINIEELMQNIRNEASDILKKDVVAVRGFSDRQLIGIASQSSLIASGILTGEITPATQDFFLGQLVELAHNFVNTLIGLTVATIERLWNAVVAILWQAISRVTGVQLDQFHPM